MEHLTSIKDVLALLAQDDGSPVPDAEGIWLDTGHGDMIRNTCIDTGAEPWELFIGALIRQHMQLQVRTGMELMGMDEFLSPQLFTLYKNGEAQFEDFLKLGVIPRAKQQLDELFQIKRGYEKLDYQGYDPAEYTSLLVRDMFHDFDTMETPKRELLYLYQMSLEYFMRMTERFLGLPLHKQQEICEASLAMLHEHENEQAALKASVTDYILHLMGG